MAEDLTKGRPFSVILKFSLPIIGGNLFQLFYTLADTIIVGQTIGEDALAAVGSTTVFVYFILCFIQGLTNGFSIILAHSIGARDYGDARRNIAASIYISLVCTVVITSITCAMAGWIIDIMEVPLEIKEDATVYLVVVLAGTGATILYNLISNILRALGDSRLPLIYLVFFICPECRARHRIHSSIRYGGWRSGAGNCSLSAHSWNTFFCLSNQKV